MTTYGPRFITPPTDNQEINPYRPVWRALAFEASILTVITLILYLVVNLFKVSLPPRLQPYVSFGLVIIPCLLWLFFSLWAEYRATQPRQQLLAVMILTMLVTSAIGSPVLDRYFRLDAWLPLAPALNRILGYTLTAGIVQGIIKYITLRYTVFPQRFQQRLDGVAYGIASGLGYATILNLQFISSNPAASPDVVIFHIFANYALHISTGIIIGYGISEVRFSNPPPLFLTIILGISSLITGISIPIHAGLVNSSLNISAEATTSAPKPLFGIGFATALLIGVSVVIAGLIRNADRLERESRSSTEE